MLLRGCAIFPSNLVLYSILLLQGILPQEVGAISDDPSKHCPIFTFENGADDWSKQGSAFIHQPIYRGATKSGHKGNWLIDSHSNVTTPCQSAKSSSLGEQATGTMTSPPFVIRSTSLTFLIGGKEETIFQFSRPNMR
ncbi:hypothetical protein OS493_031392 [Desmophyllum pertusum]|uniref:Uncharacterized protein n=1 Tax=Desmophyllum pertusum TaxID=174260 RepID=A0A9X0CCP6_9CNID|nr:hypothetical protein OS493_031392 [Desmophyllum pertusum]